jgi:hypothetical protein
VRRDGAVDLGFGFAAVPAAPTFAALGLTALAAAWWLARPAGGDGKGGAGPARALAFTPAEEHLLFPAPVTRRGLVRWKLWRAQLGILLNTVIWSVLLRGGGGEPAAWRRAAALWVVLSVMFLHRTGAALATGGWQARAAAAHDARRERAEGVADADDGAAADGWIVRLLALLPAAVFAGVAGALLAGVAGRQAALRAAWDTGLGRFAPALATALDHPAAHAVLTPARLVVAPLFAAPAGGAAWGARHRGRARPAGPPLPLGAAHRRGRPGARHRGRRPVARAQA